MNRKMCALLNPLDSVADLELQWRSSFQEVNVIVAGKYGSGKTELVNGLCGIRIKENNNPATKIQLNNPYAFEEQEIKIWDTCAMHKDSDWKSDVGIKTIREIKCMRNAESKKILLYTVPMNQTRFIPSVKQNVDLNCLRRLTIEFGVEIWRHAHYNIDVCQRSIRTNTRRFGWRKHSRNKKSFLFSRNCRVGEFPKRMLENDKHTR